MKVIKVLWPFRSISSNITAVALLGLCALTFYNAINPSREVGRGSFTDTQTKGKYGYTLHERGNSRILYAWPEGSHSIIASEVITDSEKDGVVDLEGILGKKIKPEHKERAQRFYDLALADFGKRASKCFRAETIPQ